VVVEPERLADVVRAIDIVRMATGEYTPSLLR
jgi:hypothetical protein